MESFLQVRGNTFLSVIRTEKCTKEASPVHVFSTTVGVRERRLLEVIPVLAGKVDQ